MTALRKTASDGADNGFLYASPEAFEYQSDVTVDGIRWIKSKVSKSLEADESADDEWVVVDGYRGSKN